jgi:glycine/D-amino acid oxidase-like deaminating enzyme
MFDYIVVGKGLIGSAAGRYLSATGEKVALIGPDEPADRQTHRGVFASHYDQGRITRILDEDLTWARLAQRSIDQYRFIERESGIQFYHPVGGLQVGPTPGTSDDFIAKTEAVGHRVRADFKTYTGDALPRAVPHYRFPAGTTGLLETGGAGYINPRSLVKAQLKIASRQGAAIIKDTVATVEKKGELVEVRTIAGQTYQAPKVLIAAGAYTNQLLGHKLDLTVRALTILMAEVSEAEVARLAGMPTLIYDLPVYDLIPSIYMAPPIKYPDGKYYLKIGGNLRPYTNLHTFEEMLDWFHTQGNPMEGKALKAILQAIVPGLKALSFQTKPCVTTYTPGDHPFIGAIDDGFIYVAAGGCGSAAKSSNEIGHIAARLVEKSTWTYDIDAETFKVSYV